MDFSLDPKDVLPADVYAATQSPSGKAVLNGMGTLAGAVAQSIASGDSSAAFGAAEAVLVALATAANPAAGLAMGIVVGLINSIPHAQGAGAPPNLICPLGYVKKGVPPLAEIQGWTDPTEPGYLGGNPNVGSYIPWLATFTASAGNDAFLRGLAGYIAYNRGKDQNCYFDVPAEPTALLMWLALWNAKAGKQVTVTRTIRGVDSSHPTTFAGRSSPGAAPVPPDWDAVDRIYGDGDYRDDNWSFSQAPGYAAIARALWDHQNQGKPIPDVAMGQSDRVSFQVRVPDAEDLAAQGVKQFKGSKSFTVAHPKTAATAIADVAGQVAPTPKKNKGVLLIVAGVIVGAFAFVFARRRR